MYVELKDNLELQSYSPKYLRTLVSEEAFDAFIKIYTLKIFYNNFETSSSDKNGPTEIEFMFSDAPTGSL